MAMELDEREIQIENLLFDEINPRLPDELTQSGVLHRFAQDKKTRALATHVAGHGINPLDRTAVIAHTDLADRFVAIEGNRRLAALKLLHNPNAAGPAAKHFAKIAGQANVLIPLLVRCVVFSSREEADVWVRLRHSGEAGGAGLVGWDAQQAARYNDRIGHKDQHAQALNVLNLAVEKRWVSEDEARAVKISHLTRLVKDRNVQARLGLHFDPDRKLQMEGAGPGMGKVIGAVLRKLPSTPVSEIYHRDNRETFMDKLLGETTGPTLSTTPARQHRPSTPPAPSPTSTRRGQTERKTMIPPDDNAPVSHGRCRDLYEELQNLDLRTFPNAAVVLFRVLIELSVSRYCGATHHPIGDREKLSSLMRYVLQDLSTKKAISKPESQPVLKALGNQHHPLNPDTLHSFLHNELAFPDSRTLRQIWDSIAPFFHKTWEAISAAQPPGGRLPVAKG